jgi:hypothetical protein
MISLDNKTLLTWITNTKKGVNVYTKMGISLHTWAFNHQDDMFYFQDANEDNGIRVPFTIRI